MRRWLSTRPAWYWDTAFPLYSVTGVRLAFRMGWAARKNAFLHEIVFSRRGGAFLDVPCLLKPATRVPTLAALGVNMDRGNKLDPRAIATSRYDNVLAARTPRTRVERRVGANRRALVVRQRTYQEIVADAASSPIWDVLDPTRVREAVSLYPELNARARQDVDAAMAGVAWHG